MLKAEKKIVKSCGVYDVRWRGRRDITLSQLMKLDLVTNSSIAALLPPVCVYKVNLIFHLSHKTRETLMRSSPATTSWTGLIGGRPGSTISAVNLATFRGGCKKYGLSKWKCFKINSFASSATICSAQQSKIKYASEIKKSVSWRLNEIPDTSDLMDKLKDVFY